MKISTLRLGIVLAGLSLAVPAFAQKPAEGGGGPAGAADRTSGGGAASSSGGAVDRGSGGGADSSSGSSSGFSSGGAAVSSSSSAVSSPSFGFGSGAREYAPQHRAGFNSGLSYNEDGQRAAPRSSGPSGGSGSGGGTAVTRGGGSSSGGASSGASSGGASGSSEGARTMGRTRTGPAPEMHAGAASNSTSTREVPSWSRPRGDRPTTGSAVDRTVPPPDRGGGDYRDRYGYGGYYYDPFGFYGYGSPYSNWNYYGYPYGFGMGYGLYSGFGSYYGDPYGGYSGGYSTSYGRGEQGNLKLKVKPRAAKVYVDGYFVGYVDQFDGAFQKLALNTGRHKVELKADGFETAEFDVLINPEQTVTFQGELRRIQ